MTGLHSSNPDREKKKQKNKKTKQKTLKCFLMHLTKLTFDLSLRSESDSECRNAIYKF